MSRMNPTEGVYSKLTPEQIAQLEDKYNRADAASRIIEKYTQEQVDRIIQAIAAAVSNKVAFLELVEKGIQETRFGDPQSRRNKRFKIRGVLRDALRQKSVGVIEEIPEKGLTKYAKPVGIIGCVVPATNPDLTPAGNAIYALKARNVIIFSPHPRGLKTTLATVNLMRKALSDIGEPEDFIQCLDGNVNKAMSEALNTRVDLVIATGGQGVVRRAYFSGTPAFGVGAGNSTMIFDETAIQNIQQGARNTMLSKTSDFGSGCSADGNLIVEKSVFEPLKEALVSEGGYLLSEEEQAAVKKVMWDEECHRLGDTVALSPQDLARHAGFTIPEDRKFLIAMGEGIGTSYEHAFSREKLTTLLAMHVYEGPIEEAIEIMKAIYEVGGKGHSVGMFTFSDENVHKVAMAAPVGRMMIRQPQSKANAGAFTNGMPMTSSIGCGTWGGNATSENVHLKHYMNTTWVSREIPEDKPTDEELFGEFYRPELEPKEEEISAEDAQKLLGEYYFEIWPDKRV